MLIISWIVHGTWYMQLVLCTVKLLSTFHVALGPCRVHDTNNVTFNPYSWNENANVFLTATTTITNMPSLSLRSPLSLYSIPIMWFTTFYPMNMKVRISFFCSCRAIKTDSLP